MARYVLERLGRAAFVVWAAFTVSFGVLYALPSDPVAVMVGPDANVDPQQLAAIRAEHGFDRPLLEQYLTRLGDALHGDLGRSMQSRKPVTSVIAEALPPTMQLAGAALALAVAGGAGLAIAATLTRRRWLRQALLNLPPAGVAVPSFLTGLLLLQLFSFHWAVFPAMGAQGWRSVVLPAFTMALPTGALIAQLLARSLDETLREDYIDTARAKGNSRLQVQLRHALRNAALPALTMVGLVVGGLVSGSVVVETVFSRPGLGRVVTTAVSKQDLPLVQGLVLFGALLFVVANLVVDLLYPLLDPRIGRDRTWRRRPRRVAAEAVSAS